MKSKLDSKSMKFRERQQQEAADKRRREREAKQSPAPLYLSPRHLPPGNYVAEVISSITKSTSTYVPSYGELEWFKSLPLKQLSAPLSTTKPLNYYVQSSYADVLGKDPPSVDLAEEYRVREERAEQKLRALLRLWQHAISQVEFRYPDTMVEIRTRVSRDDFYKTAYVEIETRNIRNNTRPEIRSEKFVTGAHVREWPGHRAALVFLAGLWSETLRHEALESALVREPSMRPLTSTTFRTGTDQDRWIVDPHGTGYEDSRARIADPSRIESVIREVLRPMAAEMLLREEKLVAEEQLKNEMDPWIPGC